MAGGSNRMQQAIDQYRVDITLTEKGELNYERVIELTYMFINKMKKGVDG
jgi:secreted Zn-dependent insulinase-like peptidase